MFKRKKDAVPEISGKQFISVPGVSTYEQTEIKDPSSQGHFIIERVRRVYDSLTSFVRMH